ncbi:hypothetical protein D3C76_1683720 [compost metagenome]
MTTELLSVLTTGLSGSVIQVGPSTMNLYSYLPGTKLTVVEKLPSAPLVIVALPFSQLVKLPAT